MKKILYTILIGSLITVSAVKAQTIPNADFENWTSLEKPLSWDGANIHTTYLGFPVNVQTAFKDSLNAQSGSYNAMLQSKLIMAGFPVSPGFITLGTFWYTISPQAGGWKGGIAFNQSPDTLKGFYKGTPQAGDKGVIIIELWKNAYDTASLIGRGYMEFPNTTATWTSFAIPINYNNTNTPDSMNIVIGSSDLLHQANIKENSVFYVDNLSFVTNASVVTPLKSSNFNLYPNPAKNQVNVDIQQDNTEIIFLDLLGKSVSKYELSKGNNIISLKDMNSGLYFYKIISSKQTLFSGKIVVK